MMDICRSRIIFGFIILSFHDVIIVLCKTRNEGCIQTSPKSTGTITQPLRLKVIKQQGTGCNTSPCSYTPVSKHDVDVIQNGGSGRIDEGDSKCSSPTVLRQRIFPVNNVNRIGHIGTNGEVGCPQNGKIGNSRDCESTGNCDTACDKNSCLKCLAPSVSQQSLVNALPQINNVQRQRIANCDDCKIVKSESACDKSSCFRCSSPSVSQPNLPNIFPQFNNVQSQQIGNCDDCKIAKPESPCDKSSSFRCSLPSISQQTLPNIFPQLNNMQCQQIGNCDDCKTVKSESSCDKSPCFRCFSPSVSQPNLPNIFPQCKNVQSCDECKIAKSESSCDKTTCFRCYSPSVSQQTLPNIFPQSNNVQCQQIGNCDDCKISKSESPCDKSSCFRCSLPSISLPNIFPQFNNVQCQQNGNCGDCNTGNPESACDKSSCFSGSSPSLSRQSILNTYPQFNNLNQQGLLVSTGGSNCQNTINLLSSSSDISNRAPNCQNTLVQGLMIRYPNGIDNGNCQGGMNPLSARPFAIPTGQSVCCNSLNNIQQFQSYDYPETFPQSTCDQSVPIIVTQQSDMNLVSGTSVEAPCVTPPPVIQADTSDQSPCVEEIITTVEENVVPNNIDVINNVESDCNCGSELKSYAGDLPVQLVIIPEVNVPRPSIRAPDVRPTAAPRVPSFASYPPPPIIVEGSRKSRNYRNWLPLLLVALLDDVGGGSNGGCCGSNCCRQQNTRVPYPVPVPTCNPIVTCKNKS